MKFLAQYPSTLSKFLSVFSVCLLLCCERKEIWIALWRTHLLQHYFIAFCPQYVRIHCSVQIRAQYMLSAETIENIFQPPTSKSRKGMPTLDLKIYELLINGDILDIIKTGADKSLARSDWKNYWKFAIFRPTQRSLLPRRSGWTDNLLKCFWVACKS